MALPKSAKGNKSGDPMVQWRHVNRSKAVPPYVAPPTPGEFHFNQKLRRAGEVAARHAAEAVAVLGQQKDPTVQALAPVISAA